MRALIAGILTAIVLFLAPNIPTQAADSNGAGPGTCLVVNNETPLVVTVEILTPSIYNGSTWNAHRGYNLLTLVNDMVITSTDEVNKYGGNWWIRTFDNYKNAITMSWVYEANRNRASGCDGSWIVTLTTN